MRSATLPIVVAMTCMALSVSLPAQAGPPAGTMSYARPDHLIQIASNVAWTHNDPLTPGKPSVATLYEEPKTGTPGWEQILYQVTNPTDNIWFGALTHAVVGGTPFIYFVRNDDTLHTSAILRYDMSTGAVLILYGTPSFIGDHPLVNDGVNLYFSDSNAIHSIPIGGGAVTDLVTGIGPNLLQLDSGLLYFEKGSQIDRVPTSGGSFTNVVVAAAEVTALLVTHPSTISVVWWGDKIGTVANKFIGVVHPIDTYQTGSTSPPGPTITSIAWEVGSVVWSECSGTCTIKWHDPTTTLGAPTWLYPGLPFTDNLLIDPDNIFYADNYLERGVFP